MSKKKLTNLFTVTGAGYTAPLNADSKKLSNLYGESYKSRQNAGGLGGGLAYLGTSVAAGAGGMAEGAFDLVYGMSALIGGNKRYAENLFKDNVVGEWHKDIRDSYNPDKVVSFFGDVGQGLGQSATMMIPVVGKVAYYAGAIGQGIGEATQITGELGFKETAYGTAVGVIEGTLELVLGQAGSALSKIGGKAGASISSRLGSTLLNKWAASAAWKGVAKDMISSAGGEFLEEFLSEYIDVGLKRGFKIDENASTSFGQALYAGIVGAASGAAMGGAVSGISSEYAYRSGKRVVDAGNADVLIKETRSMVDSLKIDSKSAKVDDILVNLQRSMEMYDKAVASGNERGATMYLGEIKTYRGILEVSYSVQREAIRLADVDEATATRAAQYMSYEDGNNEVGKTYTAKDFYEDKNGIRTRLAAMNWAGVFMADTQAMRESAIFDAEIYADKLGTADGKSVVQDITGAIFPDNGGTFKIAAGDIQTAEGDYMRVMRTGEDSYAIGIGNDAQSARGYRSLTREQAEAEFKRIQGQVIANREKVAQAENLAAQDMQTDNLKRNGVRIESRADQASTAVPGAEAVTTESGEAQIGNSFEQSTMNAARKAVKNFDALDIDTKSRILRWVESAEGHNISKDVISGISNIMRIRGDLQVLLAEVGEGKGGLHKENAVPGRNLIVLPSNRDVDILRETIAHELGHEVEGVEGFDQIKKAALKATKAEDIKKWENLYEGYPDADTEVAMKALGRRLATPEFIARYADRSLIRRIIDAGRDLIKYLRADEAGRLEIDTTEKLIKMMNEALIKGEVSQNEAKGESGTSQKSTAESKKRSNLTEETQKEVFEQVYEGESATKPIPDERALSSTVRYALIEAPRLAETTEKRNAMTGIVAPETLRSGLDTMKRMAGLMKRYLDVNGILPPDVMGKTAWKNGSYGKTMENTTLCVRTLTYEYFKDEVAKAIGRPLTVSESLLASQKIYDIATYPQCIYCYVAADRKSYDAFIGEYVSDMDKYIKLLKDGGDSERLFDEYLRGRKPTNAQKKRWAEWRHIAKTGEAYISASDINTRSKRNALINNGGKFAAQVRDAQRYAQSASWAKSVSDYLAYSGDILKFPPKMINSLNSEYGLRMYSFSDYTPAFIVENMQMVLDASVRGLKVLSYTKDADFVRIFGESGMAINMSCFARYDPNTKTYVEDSRQGMKWDEVKQLRSKHKNVGAVMVVTDDRMLNWALDQDWIDVIIPYHIVKTGTVIAGEYSWRNYTRESADYAGGKTANIYPTEHNNDFDTFRKLVEERGITPRFKEWYDKAVSGEISGDKYMKLVNEVRVPAGDLAPVQPKFDFQAALDSFGIDADGNAIPGGYVDKGGYMGNWFKQGVDVEQEVRVVAEDIATGRTVSDVEYGRQSIREAGGIPKKRYNLTEDAADQAAREAADIADQREKGLQKREDKAAKAERDAEIKRIETRARDYNAYYYKYDDVKALIDTINKEAKLGFSDASDAAFAAYSLLNAFRAEVYKADYRQSFLETTTDYLIEAADAQAGRELRLGDIDRRKKVYKMLNEAYERLAKVTPKQKTEGRRARAEAEAQFEHKTAELHMLLNRVDQRNFRYKTAGILEGEAWKMVTKAAKAMRTRGANVQFGAMKSFAEAFTAYLRSKATSLYSAAKNMTEESLREWNKQVQEGDNELYKRINLKTAAAIIEFAEGNDTDFTDSNIAVTVAALKTVLAVDAHTDKFINADGEAVDADKIVADELDGMRKSYGGVAGKLARTTFGKALRYGIYNVISPEAVAHRMDGILGAGHLFKGIRAIQRSSLDAQYDQMVWMMPITEFIQEQKKKNKTWWKEWQDGSVTITYTLPFGKGETKSRTITLTKGEAASLYLTSKREQAKAALALGRISVTDAEGRSGDKFARRRFNMDAIDEWLDSGKFEGMTDEEVNGIVIQLEQAMQTAINGMYAQFSATDKAFIDKISNFYQTTSKKVKQASDTRYYGSTNVFDGFYYPIARSGLEFDFDFIGANMRGLDDVSLRNYPFNKSTVKGARAQLQINDILVVLDRHSRQLAMYKNLTIPMQNLRLVYNHRLMEGAKESIDTVRKYINEYIWPTQNGRGGFDQWIGDFANAAQKRNIGGKTEFDTVLDKLQGGYVVAALGLNPSSIAKQWSTIMQMVEEVPQHIWMKAYAPAENKDKMLEKSRYASVRKNNSEIYFAQGTTAKLNDAMSYTLKGLEAGDYFVNLRMWNMAQYYIAETKGYSVGSEENLNAAGKVLDDWILRFQDTSDATTKSALQRHPQKLAQTVTMFTSAPMKKFSAWYTHLTDAIEADRLIKSGKLSDEDRKRAEKILADSKKKLAKSSGGIVAAAAFETAVTLLWAALRGKDDEDEEKKKSLVAKIALETSANVVGIVPVAGQIAESLLSGYDIDNMYESVINDGIGTVRTTYQLSAKALSGEQVESEAVMRNARSWVYLVSQTLGVPVRNLNNVFTAALNVISPVAPQAKYKYDAIFYEPTYAADMSKALKSGKTELAETIYRMSQKDIKTGGAADSAVVSEMVRLYGLEYNVLPRSAPTSYEDAEGNTVKLRAAQSRQFSEIYGVADGAAAMVVTSPVYTALSDELKAKALRVVYEIYHSRAKAEVLGAEPSVMAALSYFEAYIDIPTLVAESAYIYGIKSTKDAKRSELVREYVSGYSREAQAVLLYAAGYRSEDIKETLSEMLASLDEDSQNRAKIKLDL